MLMGSTRTEWLDVFQPMTKFVFGKRSLSVDLFGVNSVGQSVLKQGVLVIRRVSEDFHGVLANASGYHLGLPNL